MLSLLSLLYNQAYVGLRLGPKLEPLRILREDLDLLIIKGIQVKKSLILTGWECIKKRAEIFKALMLRAYQWNAKSLHQDNLHPSIFFQQWNIHVFLQFASVPNHFSNLYCIRSILIQIKCFVQKCSSYSIQNHPWMIFAYEEKCHRFHFDPWMHFSEYKWSKKSSRHINNADFLLSLQGDHQLFLVSRIN